jgi:hypothetical protein
LPVYFAPCGEVAQLGERRVRNAEVGSSILLFSTKFPSLAYSSIDQGLQSSSYAPA